MPDNHILSGDEVAEIEARANAATEGPWDYHGYTLSYHIARVVNGHYHTSSRVVHATLGKSVYDADNVETGAGGVRKMQDADFIAHARTDIPALCYTVRALRVENEWQKSSIEHFTVAIKGCAERLAQVTEERNHWEGRCLRTNADLNDFRTRAVNLCRSKANVHELRCGTQFLPNLDCDCAAKQFLKLADTLERL
jgi:hypothetical protein